MSPRYWIIAWLIALAGCGNSVPPPEVFPVAGTIKFADGSPVTFGSIEFLSREDSRVMVVGEVASDGTFGLTTIRDRHRLPGAKAGSYQAIFTPPLGNERKLLPYRFPKPVVIKTGENVVSLQLPKS